MRRAILILLLVLSLGLVGCTEEQNDNTGLANPASVHCEEQGGTLEMRADDNGMSGFCIFDGGSECEEWAYFRSECAPGESFGK